MRDIFIDIANCQAFLAEMIPVEGSSAMTLKRCPAALPAKLVNKIVCKEFGSGVNLSGQYRTIKHLDELLQFAVKVGF